MRAIRPLRGWQMSRPFAAVLEQDREGQGMQDIIELERRISAALERIGQGLDALSHAPAAEETAAPAPAEGGDLAALRAQIEEERAVAAQLKERLRVVREREAVGRSALEEKIEKLTRQLDVQGLELQRMRKTAVTLREELRRLREAAAAGLADPAQINRAMLAELDALRATRLSELAELDELQAALDDHVTEAENA